MIKLTLLICLIFSMQCFSYSADQNFKISLDLSKSIFQNYYCGNVDGFPHFKLQYGSNCENNSTSKIFDRQDKFKDYLHQLYFKNREFWNDGTSPSTFFYLYNYLNQTNTNFTDEFSQQINNLINDWNITQIRNVLLWDKIKTKDRYGVGNDDRLWYGISFMQIQQILGKTNQNQEFFKLTVEIFDWVTSAYESNICGGGIYWNTAKTYKNSITNHLYVDLAVYLYEYTQQSNYMDQAKTIADWEINKSGLLDTDSLFFDGSYKYRICFFRDKSKWTYNQGVFMRGYLALSKFFQDEKYENIVADNVLTMTQNKQIQFNFIKSWQSYNNPLQFHPFSDDPNYIVLLEFKNTKYSETTATFKGIFMRYLGSVYNHFSNQKTEKSYQICSSIEKYVIDNTNYLLSQTDDKNSYPFFWNQNTPLKDQTFTAGTSTTVLDLFVLYDFILKSKGPENFNNQEPFNKNFKTEKF